MNFAHDIAKLILERYAGVWYISTNFQRERVLQDAALDIEHEIARNTHPEPIKGPYEVERKARNS